MREWGEGSKRHVQWLVRCLGETQSQSGVVVAGCMVTIKEEKCTEHNNAKAGKNTK